VADESIRWRFLWIIEWPNQEKTVNVLVYMGLNRKEREWKSLASCYNARFRKFRNISQPGIRVPRHEVFPEVVSGHSHFVPYPP